MINEQNEQVIINNIIEELDKKRDIAINKMKKALLKDEVLKYREEEDTIDYILFIIRELTGRLILSKNNKTLPSRLIDEPEKVRARRKLNGHSFNVQ